MGVRIDAFAVDVPRLDGFLDASLADLLLRYQRDGRNPGERLTFTANHDDTFVATPGDSIRAAIMRPSGRWHGALTSEQLASIEVLHRPARLHLSTDTIFQSRWLLRAFSNCEGVDFITCLIDGHRRWWIGGILQSAAATLPLHEYESLELLFRKILRGSNCGYPIPDQDVGFIVDGLPFTPEDVPDLPFGRWDAADCGLAADLLGRIALSHPTFAFPPGPLGIAPGDSEFHDWVQENMASLLRLDNLNYKVCNLLTYIG